MNRTVLFVLGFLLLACGQSEEVEKLDSNPNDSTIADTIHRDTILQEEARLVFGDTSIIPSGYIIMESAYGDLNLDPYADVVLVLGHKSETEGATGSEKPRVLMIFLCDASGKLNLAVRNDNIVYTEAEGQMFGESFAGIEVDSGSLRVNHYGGSRYRWTADYIFEYNPDKKSWFYTRSYATMGDMLGEMNDLTETGQCIPYANDTLVIKRPIDIRKFDNRTAPVAATRE